MAPDSSRARRPRSSSELVRFNTVNPPGNERAAIEYLAGYLSDAGFETELLGASRRPPEPRRRPRRQTPTAGPTLCYLGHVDTVLADPVGVDARSLVGRRRRRLPVGPRRARHEVPGRGRGGRRRRRSRAAGGGPRSGTLKLVFVSDEETGGDVGAQLADEQASRQGRAATCCSTRAAATCSSTTARRRYGVCCGEKGIFRFKLTARGVAGHASLPRTGDNALLKLGAGARADRGRAAVVRAHRGAGGAAATASAGTRTTRRARSSGSRRPSRRCSIAARADARRDADADDGARLRQDQRDPRRGAYLKVDCRVPPGLGEDAARRRIEEVLGDRSRRARDRVHRDVVGNSSPVDTELMDAIERWIKANDPRRRDGAGDPARVLGLALVPRRVPGVRRLRLLPAAPHDAARGRAAGPQRRRADRRPRPRLRRGASTPSSPASCSAEAEARRSSRVVARASRPSQQQHEADHAADAEHGARAERARQRAGEQVADREQRERPHPVVGADARQRAGRDVVRERRLPPDHQQREPEPGGERAARPRAPAARRARTAPSCAAARPAPASAPRAAGARAASGSRASAPQHGADAGHDSRARRTPRRRRRRRARSPGASAYHCAYTHSTAPVNTAIVTHTQVRERTSRQPARSSSQHRARPRPPRRAAAGRIAHQQQRAEHERGGVEGERLARADPEHERRGERRARSGTRGSTIDSVSARASWISVLGHGLREQAGVGGLEERLARRRTAPRSRPAARSRPRR